jgi:hypothetical protein
MNAKIRKQALKIGLLFLTVIALAIGIVFPAYAETNTAATHMVQGEVLTVTAPNIVVSMANKQQVTISTDTTTQYFLVPAGKVTSSVNSRAAANSKDDKNKNRASQQKGFQIPADWRNNFGWLDIFDNQAAFTDIAAGDRLIVRASAANLAKQVLIVKAPVNRTIKGNVALTDATHITITPTDGTSPVTLTVTASTRITLKGVTSIAGYAVASYNSVNKNALVVTVQAAAPTTNTPSATVTSIAVTPGPANNILVGGSVQFTAVATYSNGTTGAVTTQVTWTSSDPSKATITSPGGLATGVAAGITNITAHLSGINSPAVSITVAAPVLTGIAITPNPAATMHVNSTQQFTATGAYSNGTTAVITGAITWASTDVTKVAISTTGLATGVAAGASNITASFNGITSSAITVTVVSP